MSIIKVWILERRETMNESRNMAIKNGLTEKMMTDYNRFIDKRRCAYI